MPPAGTSRIAAVVLAAGSSERMGALNKLLAPVMGIPVVVWTVRTLLETEVASVLVVTGHESEAVEARLVESLVSLAGERLRFVRNPHHSVGMGTSIAAGVAGLDETFEGLLIVLGDMPTVRTDTIERLIGRWREFGPDRIVIPTFGGTRGNPVLFGARFRPDLLGLAGDVGARAFLDRFADDIEELPVDDPGVLRDIDLPADLVAAQDRSGGKNHPREV